MHYIEIVKEEGMSDTTVPQMMYTTLAEHTMFQHNSVFRKREEIADELLHEMERRESTYGLQAICEGGGTANATIIKRL